MLQDRSTNTLKQIGVFKMDTYQPLLLRDTITATSGSRYLQA